MSAEGRVEHLKLKELVEFLVFISINHAEKSDGVVRTMPFSFISNITKYNVEAAKIRRQVYSTQFPCLVSSVVDKLKFDIYFFMR